MAHGGPRESGAGWIRPARRGHPEGLPAGGGTVGASGDSAPGLRLAPRGGALARGDARAPCPGRRRPNPGKKPVGVPAHGAACGGRTPATPVEDAQEGPGGEGQGCGPQRRGGHPLAA